ncbi:helix-turn-helix domain-containing protein [Pseudoscardovia radai]|nr:helix-turn-helix transcriptional regulator [Pseudoscardovia radai]
MIISDDESLEADNMDKSVIGNNIKKARIAKQMTQIELSDAAHVAQSVISQYENGKKLPSLESLASIARALGTTLDSLCEGEAIDIPGDVVGPYPGKDIANAVLTLWRTEIIDMAGLLDPAAAREAFQEQYYGGQSVYVVALNGFQKDLIALLDFLNEFPKRRDTYPDPNRYLRDTLQSTASIINQHWDEFIEDREEE